MEAEAVPAARPGASRPHLRRVAFPLGLALTRLLRRGGPSLLAGIGVAAAAAALAAVSAGSLTAEDAALRHGVRAIAPADRTLRVNWLGVSRPGGQFAGFDASARRALRRFGQPASASVVFRETRVGGALADLAATQQLGRFVRLSSGRLPHSCTPSRCEVVQLAGSGPIPDAPGLRLAVVGRGALVSTVPFGSLVARTVGPETVMHALAWHRPAQPPLLVAGDPAGLSASAPLAPIYRSYAWVAPLPRVHPWTVAPLTRKVAQTQSALGADGQLELVAPTDRLAELSAQARAGGRHLLLLGGEAAALLLAFVLVAAGGLRRDAQATRRRLTWRGARRWQLALVGLVELAAVAVVGTVVGWALGSAVGAWIASAAGGPAGALLAHSTLGALGLSAGLALAFAATLLLAAAVLLPPLPLGRSVGAIDALAIGAAAAAGVALARGSAGPGDLASGSGTTLVLIALPLLIALLVGVAAARALGPLLRALERRTRGAGVSLRLAALSLARRPGRAALVVVFLVVCVGLGLFAQTYRATLRAGQADEAAFAVPLDFTVTENGGTLVSPLEAAPLSRYRSLAPGADAVPVVRQTADVVRLTGSTGVTLLGVPAGTLPQVRRWRSGFASASPSQLALRLGSVHADRFHGVPLPAAGRTLAVRVRLRGDPLNLNALVRERTGLFSNLDLGEADPGTRTLTARIPPAARGGELAGFVLGLVSRGNQDAANQVARGTATIESIRAGAAPLAIDFRRWIGVGGGFYGVGGLHTHGARLQYLVTNEETARFRPRQATDGHPVPALVTPSVAAAVGPGGVIPIAVGSGQVLLRAVSTGARFPSLDGDFAVADEGALSTALDAASPATGRPGEVWLSAPSRERARVAAALRRAPFTQLGIASRAAREDELRHDPIARGSLAALAALGVIALALALLGLLLVAVGDLRDERGELLDLEAQGSGPRALRLHVRLRAVALIVLGLVGGLVAAALLTAVAVDLVAVTASAGVPVPPLRLELDWPLLVASALVYLVLGTLVVAAATAPAFRARAGRPGEAA